MFNIPTAFRRNFTIIQHMFRLFLSLTKTLKKYIYVFDLNHSTNVLQADIRLFFISTAFVVNAVFRCSGGMTDLIIGNVFFSAWCTIPPTISHVTLYLEPSDDCNNETCLINTKASYLCDPEYYLSGFGSVWCVGLGEWNLDFPTCEGKSRLIFSVKNWRL